jgi:hypothetical protein
MLGQAMIVDRGYAAPETKEVLLRAKTLIDHLTDLSQKFVLLCRMWACHYVGGEIAKQRDTAGELLAEAERHSDTAALCPPGSGRHLCDDGGFRRWTTSPRASTSAV